MGLPGEEPSAARGLWRHLADSPQALKPATGQWSARRAGDGQLVGAAGHVDWPADIAHVGIIVAPTFRGRGHAGPLAAAATRRAIAAGRCPQWRSATANEASLATAARVGYQVFGRQLSFRLA
ncbi:N-acetyltransferase [Egibacter rhizosphaerae]|uniref:N-acetyltransferase n=1 Tax=Egibacter rhizosphaerae TaxID=1670831 RepID=A0A411YBA3_9ACTN|nr:GNAT family protein [Egibacter rhizosphaerae]QBI18484.1 N-acetyltransferase [Egibacter rhizosphaerae]